MLRRFTRVIEMLTDAKVIIDALRCKHKKLGSEIERAKTDAPIKRRKRREIRDTALRRFNIKQKQVNQWE